MPVRFRITVLFSLLVFLILGFVCAAVYYFFYTARVNNINGRLTNRAITTARFLSQREIFDRQLVSQIDSLTTISLKNKSVQAYDYHNKPIYRYSDRAGEMIEVSQEILDDTRVKGKIFFTQGSREVVSYHYTDNNARIVILAAAEDFEGKENLQSLRNILLLSFLLGNVIVLVTGYFFSRELLQPVKKITEEVAEISAQNLARRLVTGKTRDEWFHLSATLNELLNRLQESFELQRRFISNASHELSTPLTSISSQLEVSLQREREAEAYRKVMQSIYQDVQHMSKLTQTLLEFAKASGDPGGLEINLIRVDEVLLKLPSEIARLNPSYSVKLEFGELPDDEERLCVFGNDALLSTAIRNIVVNACKYSDDHLAIVGLSVHDHQIQVSITDHGKGISQQEIDHIFQPFYRVEETRSEGGFGLGLSLADRIIKLHKGTIRVQSKINEGTSFTIRIPAAGYSGQM